jgi:hypothetical protein
METRTYLQQRILDRLGILAGLVKIEGQPSRETRDAWNGAARIIRVYFDIYPQVYDPLPGLSSPKRQTHQPPPKKDLDPGPPTG